MRDKMELSERKEDESSEEQEIRLSARLEFAKNYTERVQEITEEVVPDDFNLEHASAVMMALATEMCFWQHLFLAEGGNADEMNALLHFAKDWAKKNFLAFVQSMEGDVRVQKLRDTVHRG